MQLDNSPVNGQSWARLIAFYLPQFHPIPENDQWWGAGFTEWTNVVRARPRFPGHYQPRVPADLGYYDLRVPETRAAQANLARAYGLEAFCYYHYWFAGRRLLERPFEDVVRTGEPQFPFCLCWANQTWTGVWHGAPHRVLIEQTYPGVDDERRHFYALLPAFSDPRYLTLDGRLLFVVFRPTELPNPLAFTTSWRELADREGLPGFHFAGVCYDLGWTPQSHGFDSRIPHLLPPARAWFPWKRPAQKIASALRRRLGVPTIYDYARVVRESCPPEMMTQVSFPCVIPNWDNTARSGSLGRVLHGSTPALFGAHLRDAFDLVSHLPRERRLVFVKSWNEWAEGNYLEPDCRFGHGYLDVTRATLRSMAGDGQIK
jgi:lipopolysaccharide biosynthesis protein